MKINISRFLFVCYACFVGMLADGAFAYTIYLSSDLSIGGNCYPASTEASPSMLETRCVGKTRIMSGDSQFSHLSSIPLATGSLFDNFAYGYVFDGFYAYDSSNNKIKIIDKDGNILYNYGSLNDSSLTSQKNYVEGLCSNGSGASVVPQDSTNACIASNVDSGVIVWYAAYKTLYKITFNNQFTNQDGSSPITDPLYVDSDKIFYEISDNKYVEKDQLAIQYPTRRGYIFKGYYSSQTTDATLLVKPTNCDGSYDGFGCIVTSAFNNINNNMTIYARWEDCTNGTIINDQCLAPGKYLYEENGVQKIADCPSFYEGEGTSRYEYWSGSNTYGVESCTIKLTNTVCATSGTNVLYVYNDTKKAYIRKPDYRVENKLDSIIESELPGDEIKPGNNVATKDYCKTCGPNRFNINGECSSCNSGFCLDSEGACIECPAGYACPGNDRDQTLYCDAKIECGQDQYSESGASNCGDCALGYSTYYSGPEDGTCLEKSQKNERGYQYGVKCTTVAACKLMPAQLCFKPNCSCTESNASSLFPRLGKRKGQALEDREICKSSFPLGDHITFGAVNKSVVKQINNKTD